jgi:hypothetical protein
VDPNRTLAALVSFSYSEFLQEKVGPDVAVEAMMSNSGHVFYGDLRSHERAGLFFPQNWQLHALNSAI